MRTNTTTGNESPVTTRSVADQTEQFVEAVTDALADTDASQEACDAVEQAGDELVEEVADLAETADQASSRAREAEERARENADEIETVSETVASANHDRAQLRGDVHELTETVESLEDDGVETDAPDETTGSEPTEPGVPDAETALGDLVRLPEHLADDSLTSNQQRARAVARDAPDYATKSPAGYTLRSSDLRTVLTAMDDETDGKAYTATVQRVIEWLDELGEDDVEVTTPEHGEKTVVFDESLVKRAVAWRNAGNGVVAGETEVTG